MKWLQAVADYWLILWRPADVDEVVEVLTQRGDATRSWWRP